VAPDSFDFTVSDTLIGANLDEFHNFHPNGDVNRFAMSSFIHDVIYFVGVRTIEPLDSIPPLG
jgi:hypothetical protein